MTLISEVTNLQSTLPLLCYTFTDACHTGSTDWWVCCFEIDVFRVHTGNDTSSWRPKHNGLSPRFCPCTSSIQLVLQRPASLFTLTTYVSPLKANTSERNGDLQTLICILVARPRWCPTLSNPVPGQNWMVAYLSYTLQMKTLFHGWPIMVHDMHIRRRKLVFLLSFPHYARIVNIPDCGQSSRCRWQWPGEAVPSVLNREDESLRWHRQIAGTEQLQGHLSGLQCVGSCGLWHQTVTHTHMQWLEIHQQLRALHCGT